MGILGIIGDIFKPAAKLIDDLHTSDEEKLEAKRKLQTLENEMAMKVLEHEKAFLQAQSKIITAEAQGQSWMQRNWRPITMLTFLFLVVVDCLGLLAFRLPPQAWTLLQLGLGGYVVGRSGEKIASSLKEMQKK